MRSAYSSPLQITSRAIKEMCLKCGVRMKHSSSFTILSVKKIVFSCILKPWFSQKFTFHHFLALMLFQIIQWKCSPLLQLSELIHFCIYLNTVREDALFWCQNAKQHRLSCLNCNIFSKYKFSSQLCQKTWIYTQVFKLGSVEFYKKYFY